MSEESKKSIFSRFISSINGNNNTLKESLEEMIEGHEAEDGSFQSDERVMLKNILSFGEKAVMDIMIPSADIVGVEYSTTLEELKKFTVNNLHTRIPVYQQTLDDIIGFIHIKDLFAVVAEGNDFEISDITRQVLFVPPSMKINTLLVKMQSLRVHMAIVVDEYGGTAGLVTMEDVLEEIIGDIQDEHDVGNNNLFSVLRNNLYDVSARITIAELQENLAIKFSISEEKIGNVDSFGGLLFLSLGHVPIVGEVAILNLENEEENSDNLQHVIECEIAEADARRIHRILVRRKTTQN